MRLRKLSLCSIIPAGLLLFFFAAVSPSFTTKELRIEKFDAEIVVSPNGSINVNENIQVHFIGGPWHGLYRTIPVEYVTPQGLNYSLFLNVKSVTDADGNRLKFETSRVRHYRKLKIYVPNADNSTHSISIEYTVSDALRFFEDHDELYWNVTGDEWDVPIQSASTRIILPEAADMRDITTSTVDLAVRGYLVIEEHQHDRMLGLVHDKDYNFILEKDRSEWAKLKPHEQALLNGLFLDGTRKTVTLSDLHNQFYRYLPGIKDRIFSSLITAGYYRRSPDSVRSAYLLSGTVIGVLLFFGSHSVADSLGMASLPFVFAAILTGVVICAFGWFMPARTVKGARALEGVLGFEDFLNHVESDRFNKMIKTPQMFEKFLPFAMALGVEKNWSKAFQGIMTEPPDWYRGGLFGPQFYPYTFANSLGSMSSHAGTVFASAPRSSGGSGFGGGSGGGFSGGGFGGGGGGGF